MSVPEKALQVGDVLESRYRIHSQSSRHDLGEIYQAFDLLNHRPVEILVLPPCHARGVEALNPVRWANQIVADLQQPNLIPFDDAGWVDERPFLVRRPVSGRPLADLLARGALTMETALEITISLCEALAPLHRAGLAHGGLSPHSILLSAEGRGIASARRGSALRRVGHHLILLDAGLLPAVHPLYDPPAQPWGRFPYLSPEQAAGEQVSPASDIYVLGLLLFEMLTGRPPFRATEKSVLALQLLRQTPPSLQAVLPEAPSSLVQIVQKTLAKEPAARYRHAGQLAHLLRSQLTAGRPRIAPVPRPGPAAQLVVPPPPLRAVSPLPVHSPPPAPQTRMERREEDRPDWLLIGLMIAALIAVLGLIPLWRTVYRRYTSLPPVGMEAHGLNDSAWIDPAPSCPSLSAWSHSQRPVWRQTGGAGTWLAVQILGNEAVSESSLRVLYGTCTTLKRQWSVEV